MKKAFKNPLGLKMHRHSAEDFLATLRVVLTNLQQLVEDNLHL